MRSGEPRVGAEEATAEVHARRPGSIVPRAQQACVVEYAGQVGMQGVSR